MRRDHANTLGKAQPYSSADVAKAVEYVCPAFEVVGCRIDDGFSAADLLLIADGRGLRKGERIMTDTCAGLLPLASGEQAWADFGVLGRVRLSVA